jgi:hypothetical protein
MAAGSMTNHVLIGLFNAAVRRLVPDYQITGHESKQELLQTISHATQPWSILQIGQGLKQLSHTPILANLAASRDLNDFHDRWMKLERFGHTKNRTIVTTSTLSTAASPATNQIDLEILHYGMDNCLITAEDHLFVWGLLIACYDIAHFDAICAIQDDQGKKSNSATMVFWLSRRPMAARLTVCGSVAQKKHKPTHLPPVPPVRTPFQQSSLT